MNILSISYKEFDIFFFNYRTSSLGTHLNASLKRDNEASIEKKKERGGGAKLPIKSKCDEGTPRISSSKTTCFNDTVVRFVYARLYNGYLKRIL